MNTNKSKHVSVSYIDYLGGEQTGVVVGYLDENGDPVITDDISNVIGDEIFLLIRDVKEELNTEIAISAGKSIQYAECRKIEDVIFN